MPLCIFLPQVGMPLPHPPPETPTYSSFWGSSKETFGSWEPPPTPASPTEAIALTLSVLPPGELEHLAPYNYRSQFISVSLLECEVFEGRDFISFIVFVPLVSGPVSNTT